jgi:hypothetical protein
VKTTPKMTAFGAKNGLLSTRNLDGESPPDRPLPSILHPTRTVSHHPPVLLLTLDFNDYFPVSTGDQTDAENGSPLQPTPGRPSF